VVDKGRGYEHAIQEGKDLVDSFFVGMLKGVGRVYLQSIIDCFSRYAWGRLYTSKLPVTAVHVLNNDMLPFFEQRLHRSLLDEHFRVKGRSKWYETVDEMQADLDEYLIHYNTKRPHQAGT
jgi:transposase InsO family protein